ncbi:nucleoporin NUP42-like [Mercenaria mercenaria]|uniref:nucleoporin NUP42-like n=1 Tax=Mercenaria mercenaria TaxID=6596 RepID=UPI00234EEC11|nr:nucleoporin NUP42-like [Mercenaria mercenaria]
MVVCRFFLQGNCRYGNNCWNDHPSGGNQGFSMTAQRQLFGGGKKGGAGGSEGGGGQKVSFRDSFGQNQNPYRWISQDAQQQSRNTMANTQQMSAADIVKGLATEVSQTWEGGNMWPFSCLGFEKDMPSLPGFMDIAPEEMRWDAYEALKLGNIQPYIQKVKGAVDQLNTQRQELKNPNMTLKQKLISFIDDCRREKNLGSGGHVSLFSESNSGGDIFGSGSSGGLFGTSTAGAEPSSGLFSQPPSFGQTGNQSLFGQTETQSAFGQSGTQSAFGQTGAQSLFGQSGSQSAFGQTGSQQSGFEQTGSLFGQGAFAQSSQSGSTFGQSSFGQSQTGQGSLFGQSASGTFGQDQTQTPKPTLFGKPAAGSSPFSTPQTSAGTSGSLFQTSTPFGQSSAPARNLFGHSVTVVPPESQSGASSAAENKPVQATASGETNSVYTSIDKLTPEELEQFRAPTFTLGFIPTRPPPRELCV